jgi:hypothetical protein
MLLIGRQRRYNKYALRPFRWYSIGFLLFFLGFHLAAFLFAVVSDSDYFAVPQTVTLVSAAVYILLGLFPMLASFIINLGIARSFTLEVRKAYQESDLRNDNHRLSTLQHSKNQILADEDRILTNYGLQSSDARLFWMELLWTSDQPGAGISRDVIREYHQEPILLLKMAKENYGFRHDTMKGKAQMGSENHEEYDYVAVPERFDLTRIEKDLLKFRLDKSALAIYVEGLLTRFKSGQQRKHIEEMFRYLDLVITYNRKVYAARESKGQLTLQDLELEIKRKRYELQLAQLDTKILEEQRKQKSPIPEAEVVVSSPDEDNLYERRKEELRRQLLFNSDVQEMAQTIKQQREERLRLVKLDEFSELINKQAAMRAEIEFRTDLSDAQRKETMRNAEQLFLKQLDDFAKSLS